MKNIEIWLKNSLIIEGEKKADKDAMEFIHSRKEEFAKQIKFDDSKILEIISQNLNKIDTENKLFLKQIDVMPEDIKQVFDLRYLKKYSWIKVAVECYSSESKVMRIHKKGVKLLENSKLLK